MGTIYYQFSLSRACRIFRNAAMVDKLWAQEFYNEFGIKQLKSFANKFTRRFYNNGIKNLFTQIRYVMCTSVPWFIFRIVLIQFFILTDIYLACGQK